MIKQPTLFLLFLVYTSSVMAKVELCNFSFLANSQEEPSTLFISYLDFLNEKKALEVDEFEEILVRLESGKLINPFEAKEVNKENESYGRVFQDYINVGVDEEKVKAYLETIVQREKQTARDTDKTKKEVKDIFKPIEFGVITPGSSKGDFGIDYSFEAMTTPVTVAQWDDVFIQGLSADNVGIVEMPKTDIDFYSQAYFADKLSILKGYVPAYRFHDTNISNSTAHAGHLHTNNKGDELKINRNLTEEEGYRLPTLEEQRLLTQKAFDYLGSDFDKLIGNYAYLQDKKNRNIYETGLKKPFQIDGNSFYDVIGNAVEGVLDLKSQIGPLRVYGYSSRSRTNSYEMTPYVYYINFRYSYPHLGLRLVRTLKK